MQLLLNAHGPRVDCGKRQGLFLKTATADRYLVPLTSARSDLRRSLLIQWLTCVQALHGGDSSALGEVGHSGVLSGGAWPRREYAWQQMHLGARVRLRDAAEVLPRRSCGGRMPATVFWPRMRPMVYDR